MNTDEEPIACGFRVSSLVAVFASLILLTQVFSMLILIPSSWFFFFQMLLSFVMMFLLSNGIKTRRLAYVTAYFIYVAMYIFWGFFLVFGTVLALIFIASYPPCPTPAPGYTTTSKPKNCYDFDDGKFPTYGYAIYGTACCIMTISIVLAAFQLRFLFLLYQYMRFLPRQQARNYNVSYRVPVPTPSPPAYSQTGDAGPLPTKPPVYTEAVTSPSINPSAGSATLSSLTPTNLIPPPQNAHNAPPPSYETPPTEDPTPQNQTMTNIDLLN